jgi:arylsulfatase
MNFTETLSLGTLTLFAAVMAAGIAHAQQVTGTPGSPSATTTIDGKQLPPPPPKFGGVIRESYKDSKPWWPRAWCRPGVRRTFS